MRPPVVVRRTPEGRWAAERPEVVVVDAARVVFELRPPVEIVED